MQLSVCFAVVLALAPLAVDFSAPSDPPVDCCAAQLTWVASPAKSVDRLQHLGQAQAHLKAAGLTELAAKVGDHAEREVLSKQLAEKVATMQKLQQEIAALRNRLASPAGALNPPQQVMVQMKILQVSRGKLRKLGFDWSEFTGAGIQSHAGFQLGVLDDARSIVVDNISVPGTRTYTVDTAIEVRPGQTVAMVGLTRTGRPTTPPDQDGRRDHDASQPSETELIVLATPQLVQAHPPVPARQATRTVPRYAVPVPYPLPQPTVPVPGAPVAR